MFQNIVHFDKINTYFNSFSNLSFKKEMLVFHLFYLSLNSGGEYL